MSKISFIPHQETVNKRTRVYQTVVNDPYAENTSVTYSFEDIEQDNNKKVIARKSTHNIVVMSANTADEKAETINIMALNGKPITENIVITPQMQRGDLQNIVKTLFNSELFNHLIKNNLL